MIGVGAMRRLQILPAFVAAMLLSILGETSHARLVDRKFTVYVGGGLLMGQQSLVVAAPEAKSTFFEQGYLVEGGVTIPVGGDFAFQIGAELGQNSSINEGSNADFIETSHLGYAAAKGGIVIDALTIGGGVKQISLNVTSRDVAGYDETKFKGSLPFFFSNISMEFDSRFRGVLEVQYCDGKLVSSEDAQKQVKSKDLTVGLRAFVLF